MTLEKLKLKQATKEVILGNVERFKARFPWSGVPSGLGVLQCCAGCGRQTGERVKVYLKGQWRPIDNDELQQGVRLDVEWLEANGFYPGNGRWAGQHIDGSVCECVPESERVFRRERDEARATIDGHAQFDTILRGRDFDFRLSDHRSLSVQEDDHDA